MKFSYAAGLTLLSILATKYTDAKCCRTTIDLWNYSNMCDDGYVPGSQECCGIGSCNIFCCNCDDDKCRRSTDCTQDCYRAYQDCAATPGHALDDCEGPYGACMQDCGSRHPDHYKRSNLERRDVNASMADAIEDMQTCISSWSNTMMSAGNISTAAWTLKALQEVAVKKAGDMGLNVTAELEGWTKKFEKWDTNEDGVLTWAEAMVVMSWP